jgi:hypothetical protein
VREAEQGATLPHAITTTDLLKLIGVLSFLVDHTGVYFDPDETWWRLFGRIAAPIFFFLVGFARSRAVPWTWLAFGAALTAADYFASESLTDTTVNILLNFALLRWVLLPLWERWVMPFPWRVAALVALCVPLIPYTDNALEYGTEGWLWALFGLSHRLALENRDAQALWTRNGVGLAAGLAYIVREIHDYGFGTLQSAILIVLVAGLALVLFRFRRADLSPQPPEPLAALFRFCGRYSLEIYALSLFAMMVLAYGIEAWSGEDGERS